MSVRVRFAPSPTGFLHVGGVRTALYNWLFARHHGGKFLLRIEDTDIQRSKKEWIDVIFEGLKWLGLNWDEEVVFQSSRLDIYKKLALKLVEEGRAYFDYLTPEELEKEKQKAKEKGEKWRARVGYYVSKEQKAKWEKEGRPKAIRFFVPDGITKFNDIIHGEITFKNEEIPDFIILRSDGYPTYQFACVVDDYFMKITHVIRGDDHISNTPKQIMLYNAFGWEPPKFAHLPMILGPDKKKLSKRHGATSITEYKDMGILPEALFNFLALLGWSPGDDREILSKEELIELFDLNRVSPRASVFDFEKLLWMNSVYIRKKSPSELLNLVKPFFNDLIHNKEDEKKLEKVIVLLQDRVKTLKDFRERGEYFFVEPENYEEKGLKKHFKTKEVFRYLSDIKNELAKLDVFNKDNIEKVIREYAQINNIKPSKVIHPLRLVLTGLTVGPGLFELMEVLGKDVCIKRIEKGIEKISQILS